jgi:hypothetical protein
MSFAEPYRSLKRDELITSSHHETWRKARDLAQADSFAPAG